MPKLHPTSGKMSGKKFSEDKYCRESSYKCQKKPWKKSILLKTPENVLNIKKKMPRGILKPHGKTLGSLKLQRKISEMFIDVKKKFRMPGKSLGSSKIPKRHPYIGKMQGKNCRKIKTVGKA